ncbi:MAG TPA: UvrD-helicase domain-containing protein [Fibrobacteria bacterium]|nr:UvrD-helicase domain-containing protein [Fibrobacteria bacterium]
MTPRSFRSAKPGKGPEADTAQGPASGSPRNGGKGSRGAPPPPHVIRDAARKLVEGLNQEQAAAAIAPPGPVLVLAGAGSGKTRVLVTRIVHLLASGAAEAESVVALTFSNRAAREMEARLKSYAGRAAEGVSISTFHSLGLKLVREHAEALGLARDPGILDMHSRLSLVVGQASKHGARNKKFDPLDLANVLSQLKEKGHTPADCPADTEYGTRLPRIYKGYEKAKHDANLVDFEDLIRMPIRLLRSRPDLRAKVQARWRHFLVDEFQDTNGAQLEMLRLLVAGDGSVFVVGDDDQSIYGWRGAEMRNLLDFETHFPGARLVKLQRNYRSSGNIISASNAVIHKNTLRRAKEVYTSRDEGEPLYHHVADDEKGEMDWLVAKVKELNAVENLDWREMALLVRTNIQLREYMDQFIVTGVPFMVKGANNLLERSEVQTVLAYAKLMANPQDEMSLARVLRFPNRGFPKDLLDLVPRPEEMPVQACIRAHCETLGTPWTRELLALLDKVDACAAAVKAGGFYAPLSDLLAYAKVVEAFEEGSHKRNRVEEFLRLFRNEETRNPDARLVEVLNALALSTQSDDDWEDRPGLRLMTVHAAKGLEFHTVFLPQLDDDSFPAKPNHTDTGIEEERRLFYVAMTRAKKRLFLSWPATKIHYRVTKDVIPSRFIFEIPPDRWDGPLGKKDKEEKKEFLDNFFASLRSSFDDEAL